MMCLIFIFRWESAWYIIDTFFYFYFILRNTCLSSLFCWYEKIKKLTFSSLAHRFAVCFSFFFQQHLKKKIKYRTLCNTSTLKNKQIMISTSNQLHIFNVYTFVRSPRIIFFNFINDFIKKNNEICNLLLHVGLHSNLNKLVLKM